MKAIALLNGAAGERGNLKNRAMALEVAAACEAAGIDADVRVVRHDLLVDEARYALESDADVVIAGGGDGTISTVAGVLAGSEKPLGVLPLGTLNHFAKDLGVPLTLREAVATIADSNVGAVDLGMVNGRVFVNNSSLGMYPRAVLGRDARRSQYKMGKWLAMLWAAGRTFRRFPLLSVAIGTESQRVFRRTPLVFVGNNEYQVERFNVGSRACLDAGNLSLHIVNARNRWGILRLAFRALLGGLKQDREFETLCISECLIESRRRWLHVALDGEVVRMRPPLHYRILPGALQVCLPPRPVDFDRASQQEARATAVAL